MLDLPEQLGPLRTMQAAATDQGSRKSPRITALALPAIAAEAGVAVQTIYNTVGSKREVLGGVIEVAVRGPHSPAPPADTVGERLRAAGDPGVILDVLVDWLAEAHARSAALYLAIPPSRRRRRRGRRARAGAQR